MNPEWYVTSARCPPPQSEAQRCRIYGRNHAKSSAYRVSYTILGSLVLSVSPWQAPADRFRTIDTTTCSSCSSSVTLVLESPACCFALPTTHTQRATSQQSVLISFVCPHTSAYRQREANMCQKIRTIELDGKTVKLQIVCLPHSQSAYNTELTGDYSGTPPAKSGSEPSHRRTTGAPMVSALSTMLLTWTRSTT
jgi:hypothetical protein